MYHHKLTVHAICHSTMARNTMSEILYLESSLQARGEKATEGGDERGKCCENQDVELNWCDGY